MPGAMIEFIVHLNDGVEWLDVDEDIDIAIRACSLSGIGIEGMSEYQVHHTEFLVDDEGLLRVACELEWVGGQFVAKRELTEILSEVVCGIDGVIAVENSLLNN